PATRWGATSPAPAAAASSTSAATAASSSPGFRSISAVTLATHDMAAAVGFYRPLGLEVAYGGESAAFTSLRVGGGQFLNLIAVGAERHLSWWGRFIL